MVFRGFIATDINKDFESVYQLEGFLGGGCVREGVVLADAETLTPALAMASPSPPYPMVLFVVSQCENPSNRLSRGYALSGLSEPVNEFVAWKGLVKLQMKDISAVNGRNHVTE